MANGLWNAGFLQGAAHWVSAGALSVDEQARGAPGRAVLRASKVVPTSGAPVEIQPAASDRVPVEAGQTVELSAAALGLLGTVETPAAPKAFVIFYNGAGGVIEKRPLTVRAPEIAGHAPGRAGVRGSFYTVQQREVAPAATARASFWIEAQSSAANQTVVILALKPMLAVVEPSRTAPLLWTPGRHDDPDLAFLAWPDILKPFRNGAGGEPQPGRVEYQAGAGRPKSRRTALDPVRKFVGQIRCDGVERSELEKFWREGPGDFWMVEPDTDRLCVASWAADGAPVMTEQRGPTCIMQVGLWMETA
ncbi:MULTISPECIES: hypothetical protein [unclassified Brevundimonas]|uniref:hypothetical protein n=1 Tax=unclassified Brevundimonas TaxID=2622653 RepID=UPI0025BFD022|nr:MULTISPECIES: hypothetical protein [unclassified Brevundimonas]